MRVSVRATGAGPGTQPRRPLDGHTAYRTGSVVSALAHARATFPRVVRFDALDNAVPFELHQRAFEMDDVKLLAVGTAGHRITLEDHGRIGVLMPLTGRIAVDDGRREAQVGPGDLLLPGVGRRTTTCGIGYEGLVVIARRAAMESRLEAELGTGSLRGAHLLDGLGSVSRSLATAATLHHCVGFLVDDIDRGGLVPRFSRARASASALLMDALLGLVLELGESDGQVGPALSASTGQLARAENFVRENASEPLSIADIAEWVGTSTRSLQLTFKRHRGLTPRQFLQDCRLDLLHVRLSRAEPGDRVTHVAQSCGITHVGRCATAYRRRFGETPSETLARAYRRS
jgi:AraC-like DNA-binding protein